MAAHEAANSYSGYVDMDKWAAMDGFTDSDEEADILCSCGKVHGKPTFLFPSCTKRHFKPAHVRSVGWVSCMPCVGALFAEALPHLPALPGTVI